MVFNVKVSTIYSCSLERAFKSAMLSDLSKIHTGFIFMPKVTHVTKDENWGQPGSSKMVFVAKSITQKGGFAFMDRIIERVENDYWKIEVDDFQFWIMSFTKFVGEWKVLKLDENKTKIEYTYWLHAKNPILYPMNWLFVKIFWKTYMNRVLENIRRMTLNNEPYLYA